MYNLGVDEDRISKLRRDQKLARMPDGSEGVPISLQYKGSVPPLPREERKRWLLDHFAGLENKLSHLGIHLDPKTLSLSGQTVEAVCSVDCVEQVRKAVEPEQHEVTVVRSFQVTPPQSR